MDGRGALDYIGTMTILRGRVLRGASVLVLLGLAASTSCGGRVIWAEEGSGGSPGEGSPQGSGGQAKDLINDPVTEEPTEDPAVQSVRAECEAAIESGVAQATSYRDWAREICLLCPQAILDCAPSNSSWCVPMCTVGPAQWGCTCSEGAKCIDQVRLAHGHLALCSPSP